ncbi:iron-siderophore ABC transporter substrate-binding protein [Roseivivax marinus]|uniref:iron-siderophore ABC transporter substrate-binding protein n=1 Tax=Roseivivax marinus TaxID=1379903 RepID=UPI001F04372E|nr:iron-siderophore ABC transporter substrate-binding protein [Roseivivax marinus]UMA66198.1 iron-siderophore ABC transporter substrate-binding protein [Roseivivax marinus]
MIRLLTVCLALVTGAAGAATVEDSRGTQSFDAPPERIVVLDWALAEQVLDLGVVPVGAPELDLYRDWVSVPEMPQSVTDVGLRTEPNLERIAALDPDVIIASDMAPADVARLERIAPVLAFEAWAADHDNVAAARKILLSIATLTGRTDRAEALIADTEQEMSQLRASLEDAFDGAPPDTAVIRLNDAASVWIYGDNSFPVAALDALGVNAALPQAATKWGVVQKPVEALAKVETGAVIAIRPHLAGSDVFETPLWRFMPFVRQERFAETYPVWSYGGYLSLLRHARAFHDALLPLAP